MLWWLRHMELPYWRYWAKHPFRAARQLHWIIANKA
jgi:hypothetical protein